FEGDTTTQELVSGDEDFWLGMLGSASEEVAGAGETSGLELIFATGKEDGLEALLAGDASNSHDQTNAVFDVLEEDDVRGLDSLDDFPDLRGSSSHWAGTSTESGGDKGAFQAVLSLASSPRLDEGVNRLRANTAEASFEADQLRETLKSLREGLKIADRLITSSEAGFSEQLKAAQELHNGEKALLEERCAALERKCASLVTKLTASKDAEARAVECLMEFHSNPRFDPFDYNVDLAVQAAKLAGMEQLLSERDASLAAMTQELASTKLALEEARANSTNPIRGPVASHFAMEDVRSLLAVERRHGQAEGQCSLARIAAGDGISVEKLRDWHSACSAHPNLRRFHPWFPFSLEE
ncbi:unnamed protein product, partial [Cuscuta campestris]